MPSFPLVVGKSGPKMKEETGSRNGMRIHNKQMEATEVEMDVLAKFFGEQTSRTVTNQTGLPGHYSFKLVWTPDPVLNNRPAPGSDAPAASDPTAPSLFTAVSEQLGLKLVPHKDPAVFIFVDRAELPSAN